jgi:signal transduction histidine kinase/CheY-like chemotaxis protein
MRLSVVVAALLLLSCSKPLERVQNGSIDLRAVDLTREDPISLDGSWEFHPGVFLVGDGHDKLSGEPAHLNVPGSWNAFTMPGGTSMGALGFGSYRLRILLQSRRPVAFRVGEVGTAYRLICNGKLVGGQGVPAETADLAQPRTQPATFFFEPASGEIEVIVHVANFHYRKGGLWHSVQFGDAARVVDAHLKREWLDLFLLAVLAVLGVYHLGFVAVARRPTVFFGLFCADIAVRESVTDSKILLTVFPAIPFEALIKIEYLTFIVSVPLFALYLHSVFAPHFRREAVRVTVWIGSAYSLIILLLPARFYTITVVYYQLYTVGFILYSVYAAVMALRAGRVGSRPVLLSGLVVAAAVVNDILHTNHWINTTGNLAAIAVSAFVLGQARVLANMIGLSFGTTRRLTLKLRQKNKQLGNLNSQLSQLKSGLEEQVMQRTAQLEDAMEKAEEAAWSKSMFLATMSHELRTPLHSIIGFADLMTSEDFRADTARNYIGIMGSNARHLLQIVNDILDYSKLEAGKLEIDSISFSLRDVCQNVVNSQGFSAAKNGNVLSLQIDSDVPDGFKGDPMRLAQILINLVSNAIKFTENGDVELRVELVSRAEDQYEIRFVVKDSGIGIQPGDLKRIFERFGQADTGIARKYGGTGLGLPIVQMLLKAMNSELLVESTLGSGSRFHFVLKLSDAHSFVVTPAASRGETDLEGLRVLLVDDNELNRMLAETMLQKWKVVVDSAADGAQAVQMALGVPYDIILMDLQMPVMDGFEASLRLREMGVTAPILALSAASVAEVRQRAVAHGMNDFIGKPFQQMDLHDKIKEYSGRA